MSKTRLWIGIICLFLIGALCGALANSLYMKQRFARVIRGGVEKREVFLMKQLSRKLDLDPAQQQAVRKVIHQTLEELAFFRKRHRRELIRIFEDGNRKIKALLTEGQEELYQDFLLRFPPPRHPRRPPPPALGQ